MNLGSEQHDKWLTLASEAKASQEGGDIPSSIRDHHHRREDGDTRTFRRTTTQPVRSIKGQRPRTATSVS